MKSRNTASNSLPLLLIAGGLLLLVVVAALLLLPRLTGAPRSGDIPFPEIERVSLEAARAALDEGTAVMVDVRDPASFAAAHIPGAVSLPLVELEQRLGELDPQARIITYCT